jgi:hypothetical protein
VTHRQLRQLLSKVRCSGTLVLDNVITYRVFKVSKLATDVRM